MVLFETKSPSNSCLAAGVAFDKSHWSSIQDSKVTVVRIEQYRCVCMYPWTPIKGSRFIWDVEYPNQ